MQYSFISWNVNGLRASITHGLPDFIKKEHPDFFCMQETKASQNNIPDDKFPSDYEIQLNEATRKGYSGTMSLSLHKPLAVITGIGEDKFDAEGRVLTMEYENFFLVNTYFPNSRRDLERLDFKMEFNDHFLKWAKEMEREKPLIICGDMNVAHREIDIARPRENMNNAGFTESERSWMDKFLQSGFVDTFRHIHDDQVKYSWWSYMGNARSKNVGWRIDYFIVSQPLVNNIVSSDILVDIHGSDHAPVSLIMDI